MASGKGTTCIADLLKDIFQNVDGPWRGATNLYVSLHTAAINAGSSQNTSEAAYTSYARQAVVRTSSGWTQSGAQVSNAALITFPTSTGGSETETYVGIGTAGSGAGELLYFGALTASLLVTTGIQPQFSIGALIVQES